MKKSIIALSLSLLSTFSFATSPEYNCMSLDVTSNGNVLDKHFGNGQLWVAGERNTEYQLQLTNHCSQRVLAVVSVDGMNVLNGELASFKDGGYVLDAHQSIDISGWRKSMKNVASFYFTYPENSYGGLTGKSANLGIIGAAYFYEKPQISHFGGMREKANSLDRAAGPSSSSVPPAAEIQSLGTGHGRIKEEGAVRTTFDRQSKPFFVDTFKYDTREKLIKNGIIKIGSSAFPKESFTPDPSNVRY